MFDFRKPYPKNRLISLLENDIPGLFDAIQELIKSSANPRSLPVYSKENLLAVSNEIRSMDNEQFKSLLRALPKHVREMIHKL